MEIYKKLFEAKKEIGKISKDSTNPFYKSKYFDINKLLEHVEPILQKNNLMVLQPIVDNAVVTQLIDVESSEMLTSSIDLTQTDPQKKGIEITYYRRYSLSSLLGLQAEDDDANATAEKPDNDLKWLNVGDKEWLGAISKGTDLATLRKYFKISKANAEQYTKELNKLKSA